MATVSTAAPSLERPGRCPPTDERRRPHESPTGQAGFRALRRELHARGFFERPTRRVLTQLSLFVSCVVASIAVFVACDQLLARAGSLVLLAVGLLGISTNTHTSSHYATSERRRLNEALTYLGYPFFVGYSATYWWHKHIVLHHPAPNVIGVDDDANLLPFFAVNARELEGISRPRRFYYRMQWLVIPFAIFLNSFNMQYAGWRYVIGSLRKQGLRRGAHWIDLAVLLLHGVVWILLPMLFFPPAHVLVFYVLRGGFFSYALFVAFAPAHFPPEALFVDHRSKDVDYVLLHTSTTVNFRTGVIGRLLCAGVDYQIEHHLFPGISHVYYPAVSAVVRAYCESHGYPYRTLGWGEALVKALGVFRRPKRVHTLLSSSSSTCPSPQPAPLR